MHPTVRTIELRLATLILVLSACSPPKSEIIENLEYLGFEIMDGIIEKECNTQTAIGDFVADCICRLSVSDFYLLENQIRNKDSWIDDKLRVDHNIFDFIEDPDSTLSIAYESDRGLVFEHYKPENGYTHYIISLNNENKTMRYLYANE